MAATKKEFQLTHIFKNVSKLEEGKHLFSPREEHFNAPWNMSICHGKEHLGIFLYCNKPRQNEEKCSIDGNFSFTLKNSCGKQATSNNAFTFENPNNFGYGKREFIRWDTLLKDYLIDDVIIVKGTVKLVKMRGFPKKMLKEFEKSNEKYSDVVLVVGDRKFFVLRKFLASHSTYFESLLLGQFAEADKSEVTLNDINSGDFQNLLEVLYGEPAIYDETIDGVLHLADFFHMPVVIRKCEEFLIDKSEKMMRDVLKIAKKYSLETLKNASLSKINTADEVKAAMAGDLSEMDQAVVHALLQKSVALH